MDGTGGGGETRWEVRARNPGPAQKHPNPMQPIHIRCGHLSVRHRCNHTGTNPNHQATAGFSNTAKSQAHRVDHHRGRSRRRGRQPGAAALRHDTHGPGHP